MTADQLKQAFVDAMNDTSTALYTVMSSIETKVCACAPGPDGGGGPGGAPGGGAPGGAGGGIPGGAAGSIAPTEVGQSNALGFLGKLKDAGQKAGEAIRTGLSELKAIDMQIEKMTAHSEALYWPIQGAFGGLSDIFNVTNETAASSMRMMESSAATMTALGDKLTALPEELKTTIPGTNQQISILQRTFTTLAEAQRAQIDMSNEFFDTYQLRFNELNETQKQQMLTYTKGMDMSSNQIASIVQRQIQRTGKAGTEMLEEVSAYSKQIAAVTGVSYKQIAQGIQKIVTNVETFGNVQVEEAARIAGTLQQLGTSYKSFGNMVNKFMSFDTAASEIGKLTSVFGVHLDAMEMMQLANEDEEEFLHRIRDSFIDQGIAVDDLTKAQRNMLASTLGLDASEIDNFFDPDLMETSLEDMEAATEEADLSSAFTDMIENADFTKQSLENLQKLAEQGILLPTAKEAHQLSMNFQAIKHAGVGTVMKGITPIAEALTDALSKVSLASSKMLDRDEMAKMLEAQGTDLAVFAEKLRTDPAYSVASALEDSIKVSPEKVRAMWDELDKEVETRTVKADYTTSAQSGVTRSYEEGMKRFKDNLVADGYIATGEGPSPLGLQIGRQTGMGIDEGLEESLYNVNGGMFELNPEIRADFNDVTIQRMDQMNSRAAANHVAQETRLTEIKSEVSNLIDNFLKPILDKIDSDKHIVLNSQMHLGPGGNKVLFDAVADYQDPQTGRTLRSSFNPGGG